MGFPSLGLVRGIVLRHLSQRLRFREVQTKMSSKQRLGRELERIQNGQGQDQSLWRVGNHIHNLASCPADGASLPLACVR